MYLLRLLWMDMNNRSNKKIKITIKKNLNVKSCFFLLYFTNGIKKNTIYMLIKSAKRRLQKCILRRGTRIIKT